MPNESRNGSWGRVKEVTAKHLARLIALAPVIASLLFGVFCTFIISSSQLMVYAIAPFEEGAGSVGNALYFVALVGVGAGLMYVLLKNKSRTLIGVIIGFALTMAFFVFSIIYLSALFSIFAIYEASVLIAILAAIITFIADFAVFKNKNIAANIAILGLGGALGAFLGASIPTLSTTLILVFLAFYDAFAVYHGPVGKIAQSGLEQLKGLSFSFKDVQMGLGDLTFYSMLSGHMLFSFGLVSCMASAAGILIGCFLTFGIVEKKGMAPGLPFPTFLGLAFGFVAKLFSL